MPRGYTIFEVMIVLAVSSLLFILAVTAVNGQQTKTENPQAVRDLESLVNDVANDITTGYFPDTNANLSCTVPAGSNYPQFNAATASQGTNKDCTFIGKAIQFRNNGTIDIYTLAGNRLYSGNDVTNISQANPITDRSFTESKTLLYGLKPYGEFSVNGTVWATGPSTIVFMTSFGKNTGSRVVGSPKTDLYYIAGSKYTDSPAVTEALLDIISSDITTNVYKPVTAGYTVCLIKDGKLSALSLGIENSNLTTRIQMTGTGC